MFAGLVVGALFALACAKYTTLACRVAEEGEGVEEKKKKKKKSRS